MMALHEEFGEDLALLALGTLQGDERRRIEEHLEGCASCRRELEQLHADMALMSLASGALKPPARSRERLLKAIAAEGRSTVNAAQRPSWWRWATLATSLAAAVIIVLLMRQDTTLTRQAQSLASQVAALQQNSQAQQAQLDKAKEIVTSLTSTEAQQVTLVASKARPVPQGKAIYVRDRSTLIFIANNLPQLPADKIYELWLIPQTGPPVAAGLFKPDAGGSASVVNPPIPGGIAAKTFVVTLEPSSGPHDAPRGTAVIAGQG